MAKLFDFLMEKFIYFVVLVLLLLITYTIVIFNDGLIDNEKAKVYLQALASLATLALLFYAYSNVASKRDEDAAHLELAVRPILVWELEGGKGKATLTYKSLKHPIYDFHASLRLNGEELKISERHIDVFDSSNSSQVVRSVSDFIARGLSRKDSGTIGMLFSFHSEIGGRYDLEFSKEVVKEKSSLLFQHRKFVSAKYPWKQSKIVFSDDAEEG